MKKKKLLVIGDSLAVPTGFAYVAGMFTKYFIESGLYDVTYASITGSEINDLEKITAVEDRGVFIDHKMPLYFISRGEQSKAFKKLIETINPEIIFSVHDPWILEILARSECMVSYYWVAYTTIETPFIGDKIFEPSLLKKNFKSISEILNKADLVIPVTEMGKKALLELGVNNVCSDNIYNGLELEKECKKIPNRTELFSELCSDDHFLFMTMGLNSERKKHERTLTAFTKFLERVENPDKYMLYIHSNIYGSYGGPDLAEIIEKYKIGDKIIALGNNAYCTKERLYQLYKACDCYIALPGGEGFSYGFAEAMLHRKPTIYIDYGGHAEFANNGGLPVKVHDLVYALRLSVQWGLADIDNAVSQMLRIAKDEGLRKKLSDKGHTFVIENLGWKDISKKLINTIEDNFSKLHDKSLLGLNLRRIV